MFGEIPDSLLALVQRRFLGSGRLDRRRGRLLHHRRLGRQTTTIVDGSLESGTLGALLSPVSPVLGLLRRLLLRPISPESRLGLLDLRLLDLGLVLVLTPPARATSALLIRLPTGRGLELIALPALRGVLTDRCLLGPRVIAGAEHGDAILVPVQIHVGDVPRDRAGATAVPSVGVGGIDNRPRAVSRRIVTTKEGIVVTTAVAVVVATHGGIVEPTVAAGVDEGGAAGKAIAPGGGIAATVGVVVAGAEGGRRDGGEGEVTDGGHHGE